MTCRLLTAEVAWPVPAIIYVGIILSTLGAALQSLTGAPRLLAAIANDDILPVLKYFRVTEGSEPHLATLFTALICIGCVVIGNLDLITPTITMFFLLCYAGVNLSCFLLDLLDAPSWRPRWKFHHWSLSLLGASMCIGITFYLFILMFFMDNFSSQYLKLMVSMHNHSCAKSQFNGFVARFSGTFLSRWLIGCYTEFTASYADKSCAYFMPRV